MHCAKILLDRGDQVIGVDNLNDYYDVGLKEARLTQLTTHDNFKFIKCGIEEREALAAVFSQEKPDRVIHLAAQAGVRYSLTNPHAYIDANIMGFTNILEECRHNGISHLVYASSSSVYGGNTSMPFSEHDNIDHPVSLYAATKKANELMAHTYSHLYGVPTTGLRFFTVYGPAGRPDMAYFDFTRAILAGEPIRIFNNGDLMRDFTYIDDIVRGVIGVCEVPPTELEIPYRLLNLGNTQPVQLGYFIETLEHLLGREAVKDYVGMQPGDVYKTCANIEAARALVGYQPAIGIEEGLERFVEWYRGYYH